VLKDLRILTDFNLVFAHCSKWFVADMSALEDTTVSIYQKWYMLVDAQVASHVTHVDFCISILYHIATVHLHLLQSVLTSCQLLHFAIQV